jgi:RNA polymerase sigma-70 factor (ECF subfamily)
VRSGRGLRDEFRAFYATAYPTLVAQVLAITGDARIAKTATDTTLSGVWRAWPSMREASDPLLRARWMAVRAAAEHQAKAGGPAEPVQEIIGGAEEAAVVVSALQVLPPVQRRALVLHYMGGVTVNDMAALSGSSAEHIELLLDDGFTTLAETLNWADEALPHGAATDGADGVRELDPADRPDELDRRFDWTAEALADTAARIPDEITVPSPAAMMRRAALVRWSARAVPAAAGAVCVAFAVIIAAQPGVPSDLGRPTIYTQNEQSIGAHAQPTRPDLLPSAGAASGRRTDPLAGLRSVALTSLLDPSPDQGTAASPGSSRGTPRLVSVSSSSSSSVLSSTLSLTSSSTGGSATAANTATTAPAATSSGSTTISLSVTTTTVPQPVPTPPVDTTTPPVPTTDPVTTDPVTTDPTTTEDVPADPTTTEDMPPTEDTTTADSSAADSGTTDSGTSDTGNS